MRLLAQGILANTLVASRWKSAGSLFSSHHFSRTFGGSLYYRLKQWRKVCACRFLRQASDGLNLALVGSRGPRLRQFRL